MTRHSDGSAGDADYGVIGTSYSRYRQPEPAIAKQVLDALGNASTILNVGAGAGSYEPTNRAVTAVEPSASMRAQRPQWLSPPVDASAEALPFADGAFDASMATFTVHQWRELETGLTEMRRVTRGPVVILTCDPEALDRFWLHHYAPEVTAAEARRYPRLERLVAAFARWRKFGRCLSLSTAGMASTKPITGVPSACWTKGRALPALGGASFLARRSSASSAT